MNNITENRLQAQEYNEQAKVLQQNGKNQEAYTYYENACKADPMYIENYINLGNLQTADEIYDQAEANYKKALMLNKHDGRIYFHLGNLSFIQGKMNTGIEYYNKAIAEGYTDSGLYYSLGMLYENNDNTDLALRNYSKAINIDPNIPEYRIQKASLQIATGMYDEALSNLEEIMLIMPDVFEGYHYSFDVLCALKRFDEAKEVINKALVLFPKDVSLCYDNIRYHTLIGEYDKALELIEKTKEMDGFETEERNLTLEQGKIYSMKQEVEKAYECLNQCIALEKEELDLEARYLLMLLDFTNSKFESLLKNTQRVLEKPKDSIYCRAAYYYRPLSLRQLGQQEEALKYYKEAISYYRDVTIKEPTLTDAYMFRVLCHKDIKDYNKALELVDFVGMLVDTPEVYVTRSQIYGDMGDEVKAKEEMEQAIKLKPELALA